MQIHIASRIATIGFAIAASTSVLAETSSVSASGYLVTHKADVSATPAQVYTALGQPGRWWNSQHTYSGKSENLVVELRAGGCFCEHWEGNSIEHARVIYATRDKALRMEGGLGPLQDMAVTGILNWIIAPAEGKTQLLFTYRVRGAEAGLDKTAEIVDKVMGEQFTRLVAFVERK